MKPVKFIGFTKKSKWIHLQAQLELGVKHSISLYCAFSWLHFSSHCSLSGSLQRCSGSHPHLSSILQASSLTCVCVCHVQLCDPMDCSLPGSSIHGIFQARILEWVAISFARASSRPRDWTCVSCISCIGRWVLYQVSLIERGFYRSLIERGILFSSASN